MCRNLTLDGNLNWHLEDTCSCHGDVIVFIEV